MLVFVIVTKREEH